MYWEEISEKKWNSGKMYRSWDVTDIAQEKTEHPVIYFDMDGVLAEWNWAKSDEHPDGVTMEEVFSPGYFRGLKPIDEYIELANTLHSKGADVRILSKSCFMAIKEKWEWLQENLPFIKKEHVYFVPLDEEKTGFVPEISDYDVLIDDYNPNLENWTGIPIKAITDKNTINPRFKWIEQDSPVFKKTDIIAYEMLNVLKQELKVTVDASIKEVRTDRLLDIYNMNLVGADEFISLCDAIGLCTKGINIDNINWDSLINTEDEITDKDLDTER